MLRQGSFFYGGHFSSCLTSRKMTPGSFYFKINQFFFSWGVISLCRKMTPGHYSAGVIILLYTGQAHGRLLSHSSTVQKVIAGFMFVNLYGCTMCNCILFVHKDYGINFRFQIMIFVNALHKVMLGICY